MESKNRQHKQNDPEHQDLGGQCSHNHSTGMHVHPVVKNMKVALALNVSFTIIEFIGGILTNSVAILSDAVHDLGDSMAIGMALYLEKQSGQGRTTEYTYGKRRFSALAAFITSLILVIGSVIIAFQAIPRLLNPEEVHVGGVIWLAVLGLGFNGAAVLRLKKGSHNSLNQKAVMLHLMEDALGWVAVLVGGTIMYFTHWYWIDPVLSLGIAVFIAYNAVKNIIKTLKIFLQGIPAGIDEKSIKSSLLGIANVKGVHDLHIWTMDGELTVFTSHIVVSSDTSAELMHKVRKEALHILSHFGIQHPTLQIETGEQPCALVHC